MANLIISIDDLKEVCIISDSFDPNYIEPMIVQATDLATQNVLGTALTVKLRTDYNSGSLSGLYETMYDSDSASVKKMICWQTYQLALPSMLYKIGAASITAGDAEDVNSIGQDELGLLIRNADASRVFYENRVKEYLNNNYNSIPELKDATLSYLRPSLEQKTTSQIQTNQVNNTYTNF